MQNNLNQINLKMSSGSTVLLFSIKDNIPYIVSFTDGEGNCIITDSELSLPLSLTVDGASCSVTWVHYKTERGYRELNGKNADVLSFTFKCVEFKIYYTLCCAVRDGTEGPFEFYSELKNETSEDISYSASPLFSTVIQKDSGSDPVAWLFKKESGTAEGINIGSFYYEGNGIYKTTLEKAAVATAWVTTFQNWNESGYIPMMYIQYGEKHGIIFALEWSAGRVIAESDCDIIRLRSDMNEVSQNGGIFSTSVGAGETFLNPSIYLGTYTGDVDDGSNIYKHWFFNCKAPAALRENENEPLTQMDMQSGLEVDDLGVESVKWEYGWWSDEGTAGAWRTLEGSWELRNKGYLNKTLPYGGTLRDFGLEAEKLGINWTTYGLLHANIDKNKQPTDQFGEFNIITHPEWFSNRTITDGMGNSADLGNTECVEYLKKYMLNFFSSNHIRSWRSDFEPICYYSDKKNRHDANGTDVQYWCTKGFLEIVDYLYDNYNAFRYESCSSGGSMKDPIAATRTVVFNTDDSANYLSLRTTFYDSSYCFCPSQLQLPANPDCANINSTAHFWPKLESAQNDFYEAVLHMGLRSTMLGVMHWGAWSGNISAYRKLYNEYYTMYSEKLRPLVRYGELYHILPRPDGVNWDGVMYADPDAKSSIKGVVFVFKPSCEAKESIVLPLRGLNKDTLYTVKYYDGTSETYKATGTELMKTGITVKISGIGSEIIWLTD